MSYYSDIQYGTLWTKNHIEHEIYYKRYFKGCKRILDIGCSVGNFIVNAPDKIEGIDIDKDALRISKERGFKVKYGDITKRLPFSDNTFDAVNLKRVLEHIPNPESIMREIRRVLKPQGRIVILVPDIGKMSVGEFYKDYSHCTPLTKTSTFRLLYNSGFRKIVIRQWPKAIYGVNTIFYKRKILPLWLYFILERILLRPLGTELIAIAQK